MARNVYCPECHERVSAGAKKYNEVYEFIMGTALRQMLCDGSCATRTAKIIEKGDVCYAVMLLPSKDHPNYVFQKPENWASNFINIVPEKS